MEMSRSNRELIGQFIRRNTKHLKRAIDEAQEGQIVTSCWQQNAPMSGDQ